MKSFSKMVVGMLVVLASASATSATQKIENLSIKSIRVVGDYHKAEVFDDTIELWFTTSLAWSANMSCTVNYRVYIDASKSHLVSAAYMALATDKKVSIFADDSLPMRYGSCEISYLDIFR
jgi:hypothetical protein